MQCCVSSLLIVLVHRSLVSRWPCTLADVGGLVLVQQALEERNAMCDVLGPVLNLVIEMEIDVFGTTRLFVDITEKTGDEQRGFRQMGIARGTGRAGCKVD